MGRQGAVLALAGAAVVMRLPFLVSPEGSDEGGYLAIARQWHGPASSLYGQYWVDRPPLLITLFQLSSALGGLFALRVLAALACGLAVLGVAAGCRHVAGPCAGLWGAGVAAALFLSPQLGTIQVNGEMLAAPFVSWSIAQSVQALNPSPGVRPGVRAFLAGGLAVGALLVKQNMVEPFLFAAVAAVVAGRAGALLLSDARRLAVGAASGVATVLVLVGSWAAICGTSLSGVFYAMYPFRIRAAGLLATVPDVGQEERSELLLQSWLTSGVLLVMAVFVWAVVRRRAAGPVVWGLLAALVWASASVLLGGGFWDHYLVELIVPVAMAAGLAVGRRDVSAAPDRRLRVRMVLSPLVAGAVVVVALVHWGSALGTRMSNRGVGVGTAIAAVAAPRDTLVSAVGDAEAVEASAMSSPYPYLWTLPAQVNDPKLTRLTRLLEGRGAPTWLIVWNRPSFPEPVLRHLKGVVALHYRVVGVVCGYQVLLRKGVVRPRPPDESCDVPLAAAPDW